MFHDAHGDDLSLRDAWLCVCGKTDTHGGSWETTNRAGAPIGPTTADWLGYVRCTECGRVYDREGMASVGRVRLWIEAFPADPFRCRP